MVTTYCLELTRDLTASEYASFQGLAGPQKQKRLSQYQNYQDAQRSLCGDLLLLYMLRDQFALTISLDSIRNGTYGKPYFHNKRSVEYNLSHSGAWVVGCVSTGGSAGIDVETWDKKGSPRVMQYFSDEEKEYITEIPACFEQRFYGIWTLKESYLKAEGTGLHQPLNAFSITMKEREIEVFAGGKKLKHQFKQYVLGKNAICSVCSRTADFQGPVNLGMQQLVDFIQKVIA
ncbi:4'-phosphopantetheinyl transferase family protein [Desulfosporosinus youngiae]|uniref:Phosphopantetheinyl transferase n=1 Tax=Desulfosporosinus youngiae DSM 17734 TaxID=768710 RepID=H5XU15_9FIRM|nr:4'-phosphopantetheinyl transferase superfamily protein [Desulfosporosinus youngiae]EHQ88973.1 phosphopantetheinyl transferase [Desulfosporosinus youngiae DSM 17734]